MTIKKPETQQNIAIPKDLWHVLKVHCATNGMAIKWFVTAAIKEKMKNETENTAQTR